MPKGDCFLFQFSGVFGSFAGFFESSGNRIKEKVIIKEDFPLEINNCNMVFVRLVVFGLNYDLV